MGLSDLVGWMAVGAVATALLGIAVGLMSTSPPEYLAAKICFTAAAAIVLLRVAATLATAEESSMTARLALAFVLFGITGALWIVAFSWVATRESAAARIAEMIAAAPAPPTTAPSQPAGPKDAPLQDPLRISPAAVPLYGGQFTVRTPVRIRNVTDRDLYAVFVKILMETPGLDARAIQVESAVATPTRTGDKDLGATGPPESDIEAVVFHLVYPDQRGGVYIYLTSVLAQTTREFIIAAKAPIPASALLSVVAFKTGPVPILEHKTTPDSEGKRREETRVLFQAPEQGATIVAPIKVLATRTEPWRGRQCARSVSPLVGTSRNETRRASGLWRRRCGGLLWRCGYGAHGKPYAVAFNRIDFDDEDVVTPRRPGNLGNVNRDGEMKRRPLWTSGRTTNLKLSVQSERLRFSCQAALNHERVPVNVLNREFEIVPLIALMPIDLNESGDCEVLREWPYLVPGAAQKKEEALADLCAVRQKDFRLQGVRTSDATRGVWRLT